jgi:hypothetical protein
LQSSGCLSAVSHFRIQDGLGEITELIRRELVSFDIGNHFPLPIDDCRVE